MGNYSSAVLAGDGIGPEVIEQAVRVLQNIGQRYGHTFNLQYAMVGVAAIEAEGDCHTVRSRLNASYAQRSS